MIAPLQARAVTVRGANTAGGLNQKHHWSQRLSRPTIIACIALRALRDRPHRDLHVTSTNFDEPLCVEVISTCDQVVAIHGKAGSDKQHVEVGGLDTALRDAVCNSVADAGYAATVVTSGTLAARSTRNICNRGARKAGVQLEITRGLRDGLRKDAASLRSFANAVRATLRK
jgi:phage replication-related protein YjqB (UPF0714/DUF867 family)